ncbi:cytochrome P450 4c3-like [Oppia nitens]|uniref:cytochrome P450 4c3-like n=1 Tax=Oppia nitens TaxID=1686743 RepID=UPI0023DA2DC9|nr:cytochrome P450 4c3-like [Oppia nitens]
MLRTLHNYECLRRVTTLIPGINCQNPVLGNLDIITCGINKDAGVDAYQAFFQALCGLCKIFEKQRIFRFWMAFEPIVVFYKPETVETILSSNTVLTKARQYDLLSPWLGYGLLTSGGNKWRLRRKLLTPSFHFRILEDFLPIMSEHLIVFVDLMRKQTLVNNGIVDDITPYITRCALDIICETAMGIKMDSQIHLDSPYVKAIHQTGELFLLRMLRPWLWNDFIYRQTPNGKKFFNNMDILHGFTDNVIKERKRELLDEINRNDKCFITNNETNSDHRRRQAFLDSLLSEHFRNPEFTEEDIREEVDTFMFEGHDTTSMAISWTLHLIGRDQSVQDKCHQELDTIFDGTDGDRRPLTMNDLREMKYLEACIKEALRLFPSVPFIGRQLNEDININGHSVPKGVTCLLFLYQLHRDPECFPQPEVYRPDRFLDRENMTRHPFAYVPFSAGPRNCIGQKFALLEEKALLATILRNFRIRSLDTRDVIKVAPEMVIRPKTPIRMEFVSRKL